MLDFSINEFVAIAAFTIGSIIYSVVLSVYLTLRSRRLNKKLENMEIKALDRELIAVKTIKMILIFFAVAMPLCLGFLAYLITINRLGITLLNLVIIVLIFGIINVSVLATQYWLIQIQISNIINKKSSG